MWRVLVLLLLSVSFVAAIDIPISPVYHKFGFNNETNTFTSFDGFRYVFRDDGIILVKDQLERGTNAQLFAITTKINGTPQVAYPNDFTWTYTLEESEEKRLSSRHNDLINESYLVNETYTLYTMTGYNNFPAFKIYQEYKFYPDRDTKVAYHISNNYAELNDTKFWIVTTAGKRDIVYWNNTRYNLSEDNLNIEGNFNELLPYFRYVGGSSIDYEDILGEYEITNIRIGKGDMFNRSNVNLIGIGITKNNGYFPINRNASIDPLSSGYLTPSSAGAYYNQWIDPLNATTSDNVRTFPNGSNKEQSYEGFDILSNIGENVTITGLFLSWESMNQQALGFPCPSPAGSAFLYGQVTPDKGVTWSALSTLRRQSWLCVEGEVVKTIGNSTDTWGINFTYPAGVHDDNFSIRNRNVIGKFGSNAITDQLRIIVYYEYPTPNVTFVNPTPDNNSVIGSKLFVNVTFDVPVTTAVVESNITGTLINYSMYSTTSTNAYYRFSGLANGGDDGLSYTMKVFANTGSVGASGKYYYIVDSNLPNSTIVFPENGSTVDFNRSIILNFSISDNESDVIDLFFYRGNDTGYDLRDYIYYNYTFLTNKSFDINWTIPTPIINDWKPWAYWKLDNNPRFGENNLETGIGYAFVYDYSGNGWNYSNTTIGSQNDAQPCSSDFGHVAMTKDCYDFDGTNDRLEIAPENSTFNDFCTDEHCTISAWVYDKHSGTQYVFGKGNTFNHFYALDSTYTGGRGRLGLGNGTSCFVFGGTPSINVWKHLVLSYNSSHLLMYVDGELVGNTSCTLQIDETTWDSTIYETYIGGFGSSGADYEFNGYIDEVMVLNYSVNLSQVQQLYHLQNETYYIYTEYYQSPNNTISQSYNFTGGVSGAICEYLCSSQIISSILDCSGNALVLDGAGTITFENEVTADNVSVTGGCFAGFLDKLNIFS